MNLIKTGILQKRIWAERYYRYVIAPAILKWFTVTANAPVARDKLLTAYTSCMKVGTGGNLDLSRIP